MIHTALSATHMVDISLRDPGGGEMIKVRLQGTKEDMVGMNPITRKELREKIKKDSPKMSETTLKKYSDAPFDGAYPMFVVKDDKATLDITAFRSFIEELCKYVGTDAAVLFTGPAPAPGGRKGDNPQIAKVPNKAENPQILIERKKNTELSKQIADLEKQIEELRLENQKIVADSVLANMSKEVNICLSLLPSSFSSLITHSHDFFCYD